MVSLWNLFFSFAKIGICTFGGGYAMLPVLTREVVTKREWATEDEVLDYYAIGQCTPGIIAVNTATFIGYKKRGIVGAIAATAGLVFPSFVIIILIASCIRQFADLKIVQHAFAGVRVAVCALVLHTVYGMAKKGVVDWLTGVIAIAVFLAVVLLQWTPAVLVLLAGGAGIVAGILRRKQK